MENSHGNTKRVVEGMKVNKLEVEGVIEKL